MQLNFNNLPDDLKIHTMSFLDKESLAKCGRVDKELNKLSSCDFLWKTIFDAKFATYINLSGFNSSNYKPFVIDNNLLLWNQKLYNRNKIIKQIKEDIKFFKSGNHEKIKFLIPDYNSEMVPIYQLNPSLQIINGINHGPRPVGPQSIDRTIL